MIHAALLLFLAPALAHAGSVTVRNGSGETISGIHMAPSGSGAVGENRMRSQLPPGAEARITYSTGCQADVRIAYASGRTEVFAGLDVCVDARVVAGSGGVAGPAMAPGASSPAPAPARPGGGSAPAVAQPAKAPQPAVPPWTGRSLTRRFGGME